ncbi:hypothetical protein GO003_011540 [Methylicorpusculum oleiharenae]|uniref:hypothetical protein n=1 Tax=Methylicorpusculum oleiharenae TaxID=1338687 RepID=UPI00135C0F35|nr:hypothetical protein [Methylicorpusculum oleiharenae]MCD2451027.1 hypothetical protein [Methylicorpusculum oleiharenae]
MEQQSSQSKSSLALTLWQVSKVLLFIALILGLGSLNVLTLINDQAHAAGVSFLKAVLAPALAEATMSRILSLSPTEKYGALEKSHRALESKLVEVKKLSAARSQVVKNISKRVATRAITNAGKNVASYAAEVVPVVGVAAITNLTISDLYDDCQTLKDINELNVAFGHAITEDNTVCGIKFP